MSATPRQFVKAAQSRLHINVFSWDLAASAENSVCQRFIGLPEDSLSKDWWLLGLGGWLWLNPPFNQIAPWAAKCWVEAQKGARIALLVPASVGSHWYAQYVHDKALVLFLRPRLCFLPDKPREGYSKDCLLALYGLPPGFECWDWK